MVENNDEQKLPVTTNNFDLSLELRTTLDQCQALQLKVGLSEFYSRYRSELDCWNTLSTVPTDDLPQSPWKSELYFIANKMLREHLHKYAVLVTSYQTLLLS